VNFRIPIWYELKQLFMARLVLPNFRGAAFIYNKFVREQVNKHNVILATSDPGSVSNNGRADDSTSPKEKKNKKMLLSAHQAPARLPRRHLGGTCTGAGNPIFRPAPTRTPDFQHGERRPPVRGAATNGARTMRADGLAGRRQAAPAKRTTTGGGLEGRRRERCEGRRLRREKSHAEGMGVKLQQIIKIILNLY
jgi:hypothetical protein